METPKEIYYRLCNEYIDKMNRDDIVEMAMTEYAQSLQLLQPDVICSLYQGVLNEPNARCEECGKAEWQHK